MIFRAGGSTVALSLYSTGAVQLNSYDAGTLTTDASGNVTASSDIRLKDVEGDFSRGLDALKGINPILYSWNKKSGLERNGTYAGFSAQNIKSVIPETVDTDGRGYLTLQDRPILAGSGPVPEAAALATGADVTIEGTDTARAAMYVNMTRGNINTFEIWAAEALEVGKTYQFNYHTIE